MQSTAVLGTQRICIRMESSACHGRAHGRVVANTDSIKLTVLSTANRLRSPLFLTLPLLFILLLFFIIPFPSGDPEMDRQEGSFLYFAYGSNLLKERLQLKNPSAAVYCVARLKDYKLMFGNHKGLASQRWQGGVATIEPSTGDEVWGVVWRMNITDLESLDRQENVKMGIYSPMEVSVSTSAKDDLNCRTYIMNSCVYAPPSPQYLQVIVMGAEQNGLPEEYQKKLRSIETNKFEGQLPVMEELEKAMKKSREQTEDKKLNE